LTVEGLGARSVVDPVVARVAGRPIRMSHLDERMRVVRRGPRGRHLPPATGVQPIGILRWMVRELVTEAVLVHEARTAGVIGPRTGPADREHETTPGSALSPPAVAALVEKVTGSVAVDEHDVRDFYDRNRDRYHRPEARRVRHVLLADEASALRVIERLAAGETMAAIAAAESIDAGSRGQAGVLGDVHRGELSGPLEVALFDAAIGQTIGPVRTEHGWHVARVEAVVPDALAPFAEVRQAIEAELLAAARTLAFGAWLDERCDALAVIEPGWEHPADPIHGVPSHRH
jgi:[acyl-carrier-protein] S-malonyltransferase